MTVQVRRNNLTLDHIFYYKYPFGFVFSRYHILDLEPLRSSLQLQNMVSTRNSPNGRPNQLGVSRRDRGSSQIKMDDILRLNVGGRIFLTTRESLCAEGGSMLANKFDPVSQFAAPVEFEGAIFINRDPDSFKYVLNYLRNGCRPRFGTKGGGRQTVGS